MKTKYLMILVSALMLAGIVRASGTEMHLEPANIERDNVVSLQHGAKLFVNYCLGCHSLKYLRYERLVEDLKIPADIVKKNLMFVGGKLGDTMRINMDPEAAGKWFGTTPPDLSLMARAKGVDYLYNYLKGFYRDDSRPWGVNNTVFKDVGMPHVLEPLQGLYEKGEDGKLVQIKKGELTPEEYDQAVRDLVNFLAYAAEPMRSYRIHLGVYVILFLLVFFVLSYFLKKEYWKDVH
ncbi:MAG: cytochrome c1 [Gammaproteobacteria bacterium]|nr:MAG: cytochrome c1 [Gammaproteobacteria bacterium]